MNILHLLSWIPTPENPTLGNFCMRMIDALPKDCHSVILSVCDGKNMAKPFEIIETKGERHTHVQIFIRPTKIKAIRKLKTLRMYQVGLKYIKRHFFEPDLIHLHVTYPTGQMALLWHWLYGYKYVLTEHWCGYQPQNRNTLTTLLKRKITTIANNAAVIMPVSQNLKLCMEQCGIHNRYHVIYNLADTDLFKIGQQSTHEKKRMLHISTLRDDAKNFSGILRTVERLHQQRNDFELHVIHDYEATEFKSFVQKHGLSDCVIFHGPKTSAEVAQAYQEADFLVMFSNYENLPCVIVEAFASGVPVLSTNVGGIPEILSPERGVMIHPGDEDALLLGMNSLLDHSNEYNHEAIRAYAIEHFATQNIGQQIFDVYLEASKQQ